MRPITSDDLPALEEIIESTGLFPSEMLQDMTAAYFAEPGSAEIWMTQEVDNKPAVIAYCAPERMTEGTYNLYLIAVHKNIQGKGIGSEMMLAVEQLLREKNVRLLLVETSGLPEFERTRTFYDKLGYKRVAVVPEFYQAGEDKIIFWKKL